MSINSSWTESKRSMERKYEYRGKELYICCNKCFEWKHEEGFSSSKRHSLRRYYTCKACSNIKRHSSNKLDDATENTANYAREILMNMGFDIEGDIHEQFIQRIKDKKGIQL